SFGVLNTSGMISPYSIKTNEVVGRANISSLLAYNATARNATLGLTSFSDPSGASLQLNSLLVINDLNGAQYVYWPQNVALFLTNESNNIANYSRIAYKSDVLNLT